jgi:[ribosomal protein S18]-alanine N-acetyltransferase
VIAKSILGNMTIREYKLKDKQNCIDIFQSNCPKFFDKDELQQFIAWLDHQADPGFPYQSPTYKNTEVDAYYVIEHPQSGLIACGGFYVLKNKPEARLAWGMVHSDFHNRSYGTALYEHRKTILKEKWPAHKITLLTSQHTNSFYEKMGLKVLTRQKDGFGPGLDQVDMTE